MVYPTPQPTFSCTKTRTSTATRPPVKELNIHQLKKDALTSRSRASKSSNWSAPNVEMLGLVPPAPMAMV
ncbi:hypothetical protein BDA96_09G105700 [Sorghum bicolor]|uniref:Uncharacterized protein n=2 Tax=PACMAD clade TaxID=147370 RepID=A0A921QAX9_SORBI|nr:hypothetical protein BDA96_09G105700 [Sorghum bicolor]